MSALAINPLGTPAFPTTWGNVAPRAGIAYQLSRNPQWGLVLRAGWGLFYDTGNQAFSLSSNPWNARYNNLTLGPALVPFPVSTDNVRFITPPALSTTLPINGQADNLIDP